MSEVNKKDDEITLIDLICVLWKHRTMIILTTCSAIIASVVFSIITIKLPPEKSPLPNKYTPRAQMLINDEKSENGLASMLGSSGIGGLASLAGVNVAGGATHSALASYLTTSNSTLDSVIEKYDLIGRYKIATSPKTNSRKVLSSILTSSFDKDSGIFTISFTDTDPKFACEVVNYVVSILEKRFIDIGVDKNLLAKENLETNIDNTYKNILDLEKKIRELESKVSDVYSAKGTPSIMMELTMTRKEFEVQQTIYTQLKTQYEMLKVSMSTEKPVFQILEYAEVPDQKSGPSRGKLCMIITFSAFFLSVFFAFVLNSIANLKNDSEVIRKFKDKKDEQ